MPSIPNRTPSPRTLTALIGLPDGNLVGVAEYGGRPISLLVGPPGEPLREIPVTRTRVMRDGGTTHHHTAEGELHLPASIGNKPVPDPTWAGSLGRLLDPSAYAAELDGIPVISGRPARNP